MLTGVSARNRHRDGMSRWSVRRMKQTMAATFPRYAHLSNGRVTSAGIEFREWFTVIQRA